MIAVRFVVFVILVMLNVSFAHADDAAVTVVPRQTLHSFFRQHCVRCHGPETQEGQVRVDKLSWNITSSDSAQRWQDILDVLNGGDMPPEDEPQPESEELAAVLSDLTRTLQTARRRLSDHGGEVVMRRLNRREYAATIRDLFGFHISSDMIPEDNEAESFDTVGAEQYFTSAHFGRYLELGREIAARGFDWAGKPRLEAKSNRRQPEEFVTDRLKEKLADLDNKMRLKNEGKTWQEMGFKDEGEMQIVFSQFKNRAGKPRRYLQYPLVDSGIYVTDANNETRRFGTNRGQADPRGTYRYRIRAGIVGQPPGIRTFVRITDNEGTIGTLKVRGTVDAPEVIEMTCQAEVGNRNLSLHVEENRADIRVLESYLKRIDPDGDPDDQWAAIWIDWVEIDGPFYNGERAFFEKLFHPEPPVRGKRAHVWTDNDARDLIQRFAFEAFRRQEPATEFVDQLVALFEENRANGQKFETAMSESLAVVLASPGFLFLQEAGGVPGSKRQLDDHEFAIRLAYFLWSCPPDAELYACAADRSLSKPDVLRTQVDRMLEDPKSAAFTEGFMSQWSELDRFNAITVDENKFVHFNKGVRHSAYREVLEFFKTLVAENLPVAHLIDSDFVVIDSMLGEHYGISGATSNGFQKVSLPVDSPRGGLLGQTAFLTLGSNGERSSPVIRGAMVMEKILHDKPAPPPPNVPELGAASKTPATNRQMVELHQKQAVCASCHQKMDVIGFGLENFDPIGKWRDTEKVGRKNVPIEPGGMLPGGAAFSDVQGLKTVLMKQKERLAEELVESMLAYGLGRTIEFSDANAVAEILTRLKTDNYRVRSMIHEIVDSDKFRSK